jgi:mono/diheme cytochrome c family protein
MKSRNAWYAAAAALALVLGGRALADDHHRDRTALLPVYKQECASCHVAYPPGLLPRCPGSA